ncbi:MAG: RnfABCDGE type electron transport complex subunit B [Lachnospiraceae bacterium]|nr:RnfABCDGE type electron transport complex subunit B [Lachnospiraceae bacterium]
MNVSSILIATAIVAAIGLLIGLFLGIAGIKFKVETDPREEEILANLPGNNCGGCGYPGCSGLAAAIVAGEAPVSGCPVGGSAVASKVAAIMGEEAADTERMVAFVKCNGNCEKANTDYDYVGTKDCRMAQFAPGGGPKSCNAGCMGYGSCVSACPFDAIHVISGIAVVDKEKCKACGKCIAVCPKHLIELIPYSASYAVACNSHEKGPVVMKACQAGCVGCMLCQKNCPAEAVSVTDALASIDQEACKGCGICAEKCPKKCIINI